MKVLAALAMFGLFVALVFAVLLMLFGISRYALFLIQNLSRQHAQPTRLMTTLNFVFLEHQITGKSLLKIFLASVFVCAFIMMVVAAKQIMAD